MLLNYDIGVNGQEKIPKVLRGIEREYAASLGRVDRVTRSAAGRAGVARSGPGANPLKGLEQIGRVAAREEMKRHRDAMRNRAIEEAKSIKGLEQIGRVAAREEQRRHRATLSNEQAEGRAARIGRERLARRGGAATSRILGGAARGVATIGGGLAAIGGGFAVANAIESQMSIAPRARALANQAGTPGRKDEITKAVQGIAGSTSDSALGALESFQGTTGDLQMGLDMLQELGDLSLATGADLKDLAAQAGNSFNAIKTQAKNPIEAMQMVRESLLASMGIANRGSLDPKDIGTEVAKVSGLAGQFAGSRPDALRNMIVMANKARESGATDASEAFTASKSVVSQMAMKSKELGAAGVNVFADKAHTQYRAMPDILAELMQKTGGAKDKLAKIFSHESLVGVQGFGQVYTDAEKQKKGSGGQAIRDVFADAAKQSLSADKVRDLAAGAKGDADIQLQETMKEFNRDVGTQLVPAVRELIPVIKDLTPYAVKAGHAVAEFAKFAAANPFAGLGAVFAGFVLKDLAAAGIGSSVKSIIEALLRGGGVPLPGGAGVVEGALGGGLVRGGLGIALAAGGALALGAGAGYLGAKGISALDDAGKLPSFLSKNDPAKNAKILHPLAHGNQDSVALGIQSVFDKQNALSPQVSRGVIDQSGPITDAKGKPMAGTGAGPNADLFGGQVIQFGEVGKTMMEAAKTMKDAAAKLSTPPIPRAPPAVKPG